MRLPLAIVLAAGLAAPAFAHHGWGAYDADNPMTIEGEIAEITLDNPHGEMVVEHEGERWLITLAPPSRMQARGATEAVLEPGTPVTVYGYPLRDGSPELRAEWIEVDGRRFGLR